MRGDEWDQNKYAFLFRPTRILPVSGLVGVAHPQDLRGEDVASRSLPSSKKTRFTDNDYKVRTQSLVRVLVSCRRVPGSLCAPLSSFTTVSTNTTDVVTGNRWPSKCLSFPWSGNMRLLWYVFFKESSVAKHARDGSSTEPRQHVSLTSSFFTCSCSNFATSHAQAEGRL